MHLHLRSTLSVTTHKSLPNMAQQGPPPAHQRRCGGGAARRAAQVPALAAEQLLGGWERVLRLLLCCSRGRRLCGWRLRCRWDLGCRRLCLRLGSGALPAPPAGSCRLCRNRWLSGGGVP